MALLGDIGFIFHTGIYSYYKYDNIKSARRRKLKNGSEWYLPRLVAGDYRPPSGTSETKTHHIQKYNNADYYLAPYQVERDKISEWMNICKKCKATYVIITAKHHDGVCLWNTNTRDETRKTKNDIVMIFKEEAEKIGLEFGVYYSFWEATEKTNVDYFNNICVLQIQELMNIYNPKHFWLDGDWPFKQKIICKTIDSIVNDMKHRGILVNDRLGNRKNTNQSYNVNSDRYIPSSLEFNWQHINTIGISWAMNTEQDSNDYKSGQDLVNLLNRVISLGGKLLLNIASDHLGNIDPNEYKSLCDFADIINQ